MKKLGITAILILLLAVTLGTAGARAADHPFTVMNSSKDTVTVEIVWSGGGVAPIDLKAGETHEGVVPSAIDSVKVTVTGHCRRAVQTFNPQRADRATIDCKNDVYTLKLGMTVPAS